MDKATYLEPGEDIRPHVTDEIIRELLQRLYDIRDASLKKLNGYDDKNYFVQIEGCTTDNHCWPHGYVLKVMNTLDSQQINFVEAQNAMMLFLGNRAVKCPQPIKNTAGQYYSLEEVPKNSNKRHVVRLLTYQPGKLLNEAPSSCQLHYRLGKFVAFLSLELRNFHHPAYDGHKSIWLLESVPLLRQFTFAIRDNEKISLINEVITVFEREVLNRMDTLEKGMLHGDLNEQNIVVHKLPDGSWDIDAVLDFGDSQHSCLLFELAVAACYATLLPRQENDPLDATGYVIAGYSTLRALPENETHILRICICARLAQSHVMSAYTHLQDPDNQYVMTLTEISWITLKKMWSISNTKLCEHWLHIAKTYQPQ